MRDGCRYLNTLIFFYQYSIYKFNLDYSLYILCDLSVISISTASMHRLYLFILPYMHSSMLYKLDNFG